MKFVYFHRDFENPRSGVNKKIDSQLVHFTNQGVDCEKYSSINANNCHLLLRDDIKYQKLGIISKIYTVLRILKRESLIDAALKDKLTQLTEKDIIYMRTPYPFYGVLKILKQARMCKVVIEYQTIEPLEYKLKRNHYYLILDFLFGNSIRKYADAIVGVTDEITHYQLKRSEDPAKPHITIGNGFDVASAPRRNPPEDIHEELHLLCVANVSRWHGLDRLLQGLANYNGVPDVILHIAGDGEELPHLQKLANDLGISDRVAFHGFKTGKALDALFDQCHIAVGSLGVHRIGLKEASILKVREYCARGIPFIYGIPDPDFLTNFPYILHLPADESPIGVKQVLSFAKEACADPDHPQKMRRYAEEHLDWSVKMKKLKDFLETLVGENGDESVPEASTAPIDGKRIEGSL